MKLYYFKEFLKFYNNFRFTELLQSTEFAYILYPIFPLLLTPYLSMLCLSQFMSQYRYIIIKVHTLFRFQFFCSRIPSRMAHNIY